MRKIIKILSLLIFLLIIVGCKSSKNSFASEISDHYNGKKFIPVTITEAMVGHKLGEFSPTRTFYGHTADKKSKR